MMLQTIPRPNVKFFCLPMPLARQLVLVFLIGAFFVTRCPAQPTGARKLVSFGTAIGPTNDTLLLDVNQDIAGQLLPFDELVQIAVAYSPLIKYQNEVANSLNSAYAISKAQILQNVAGFVNYSGGDQSIVSTGSRITGADAIGQIANGYRVGVDLRVSLYDLFGRKHQIKQAHANYRAALVQKDAIELQIRRELIAIYQDMVTAQQVLKVRLLDEQASLTAYRIAEVELRKGKLTAEELANATNRYAQTKSITEQVRGDFLKNVRYFEALVGVPIGQLKRI